MVGTYVPIFEMAMLLRYVLISAHAPILFLFFTCTILFSEICICLPEVLAAADSWWSAVCCHVQKSSCADLFASVVKA